MASRQLHPAAEHRDGTWKLGAQILVGIGFNTGLVFEPYCRHINNFIILLSSQGQGLLRFRVAP